MKDSLAYKWRKHGGNGGYIEMNEMVTITTQLANVHYL